MLRTREGSDLPRVAQTQHLSPKLMVVQWTEHGAGALWYISVSSYRPSLCARLSAAHHGPHGGQTYCSPRIGSEVTGPGCGPDSIPLGCMDMGKSLSSGVSLSLSVKWVIVGTS